MGANKHPPEERFSILPLCILKDEYRDGRRVKSVGLNDVFKPTPKAILKSIRDAVHPEYPFTGYHYHEGVEILRVLGGDATVVLNNRAYRVHRDDIIVVNAFEAHGIYLDSPDAYFARTCIIFQPHYLFPPEDGGNRFFTDLKAVCFRNLIPASHPQSAGLRACVDAIAALCEERAAGWSVAAFAELIRFYSLVIGGGLQKEADSDASYMLDFMKHVSEYIEQNLDQDISTTEIAAYCQYSTEHFCRLFKRCFGKTFKDYLNIYRVQKAKTYIDVGNVTTIAEISSKFGFNNQSHFSRIFRKYIGVLPSEYLNQKQTKKESN